MGKKNTIIKPRIYFNKLDLPQNVKIHDVYASELLELFVLNNPEKKELPQPELQKLLKESNYDQSKKIWVYFPWLNTAIAMLGEDEYFALRTARNRNIVSISEQMKYRNFSVGIIGLSIGSVILSALVSTGGPKMIKIADNDIIEITNLNRMSANLLDVGEKKCIVVAKRTWEIDPFAEIAIYDQKIDDNSIDSFILGNIKIGVFIDAMDSLPLKVKARILCKKYKIPVVMATSNGDGVILDIERYDIEPNLEVFQGRLGNVQSTDFQFMSYSDWVSKALKIVDPNLLTQRLKESITELGKSLSGIPQLSTTVQIGAAATAYAVRKIANNEDLPSGRYLLALETLLQK